MASIADRILAARRTWCDLGDGREVQLQRPGEVELIGWLTTAPDGTRGIEVTLARVQAAATAWRGITDADIQGKTIGSDDPVDFEPEAWALLVADRMDWMQAAAQHLLQQILSHAEARAAASGN